MVKMSHFDKGPEQKQRIRHIIFIRSMAARISNKIHILSEKGIV